MADFLLAIEKILKAEGGYVDDPDDYGGETNFGISKRSYPELDIKVLTREEAIAIYKRDYWDKLRLDEANNQDIAEELFDTAVNQGWSAAADYLQEAINLLSYRPSIVQDGIVGPKTLSAVNNCPYPGALLKILNGLQFVKYYEIVKKDTRQLKFFRNWLTRVSFND